GHSRTTTCTCEAYESNESGRNQTQSRLGFETSPWDTVDPYVNPRSLGAPTDGTRKLTPAAPAVDNIDRARSANYQGSSQTAPRQRRVSRFGRRASEIPVRAQHGPAARRYPLQPRRRGGAASARS